jgi:hypothetical protein
MDGLTQLKRTLLSLPELPLRVGWLRDHLASVPDGAAAELLNALCEDNERSTSSAREALLVVAVLFAGLGDCAFSERLRQHAHERHLLALSRMLRRAPSLEHSERPIGELPVPDYGAGRELTLGERKSLARSPSRQSFEKLLSDPHPQVIRQLLLNPRLTEDDVVRLAARRPARVEVIEAIAHNSRWLSRARVRLTILLNPGSPPAVAMPLLAVCTRGELLEIVHGADASMVLRATAQELLQRRPPLAVPEDLVLQ